MALLGAQFVNAVSPNPVGSLQAYAGPNAPTGWLLCDGSSYSTSAYPELYDAIGYTYGGSAGTFYVPDLRGRMPIGAGNDGTAANNATRTRGDKGGDTRMPIHTHTANTTYPAGFGGTSVLAPYVNTATVYTNNNQTMINQAGSGTGDNMPPFLVTNYIIKAVPDAPRSGLAYGSTPPIVTQLPSNPQFGEQATLVTSNGAHQSYQWNGSAWIQLGTSKPPMCVTTGVNTSQSLTHGSFVAVEFTGADTVDTDDMHNPSSNPSRFTVNTAGVYVVQFTLLINSLAVVGAVLALWKNGAMVAENGTGSPISASAVRMSIGALIEAAEGDYIEPFVYQDSSPAAARNPFTGRMSLAWIGQVS